VFQVFRAPLPETTQIVLWKSMTFQRFRKGIHIGNAIEIMAKQKVCKHNAVTLRLKAIENGK
jgi:hypothetical protein